MNEVVVFKMVKKTDAPIVELRQVGTVLFEKLGTVLVIHF